MSDEVLTIIEPSVNGSEPRVLRFEDGKLSDKGTYMEALRKAELQRDELLEEHKEWASLIGQVYLLIRQGLSGEAADLIAESQVIDFPDGEPVAVSDAITKAEGGE